MIDSDQQRRLQRFWGEAIFCLGALWGFANLVYWPVAALTSIAGSSWFEGCVIAAGGVLSFCGSTGAFYRRRFASRVLLAGGIALLLLAILGKISFPNDTRGYVNLALLFFSGITPIALGIFGLVTGRKGWPPLRGPL
jgi:hypothetical protein